VNAWGEKRYSTDIRSEGEPLDTAASLAAAVAIPAMSCVFGDDILEEIDSLLRDQDVLIGFWQAGGE
jgi:hypothetical protein